MLANRTNINNVNMNGKKDFALEPAVSFIILATNVKDISAISCIFEGIKAFLLVPRNKKSIINIELTVINKLALVKERFTPPKFISGPIL
tara:strand:- start:1394 stop:1663 length:270 start_codon:yes stop_codon:yes gene_type:complete